MRLHGDLQEQSATGEQSTCNGGQMGPEKTTVRAGEQLKRRHRFTREEGKRELRARGWRQDHP